MRNPSRLDEKFQFYQRAYDESSRQLKENESYLAQQEIDLKKSLFALADEFLGTDLSNEERSLLQDTFGFSFSEFDRKYEDKKRRLASEQYEMESDPRTKEYLEMVITPDLDFVLKLENDETFNFMIAENFHNTRFVNEPYFEIFGMKYQPRFWKFKKVAQKKAAEFRFSSYVEMIDTWNNLRSTFESLIGDKRVEIAVQEAEAIEAKLNDIKEKINALPLLHLEDTKTSFAKSLQLASEDKFSVFENQEQVKAALVLRSAWSETKSSRDSVSERMNSIMENISRVEELIYAVDRGQLDVNSPVLTDFYNNTDPTASVFKLIPEHEWEEIKTAFASKGISLGDRGSYTKVETKITTEQKEKIFEKYDVTEGEIFIDEDLVKTKK